MRWLQRATQELLGLFVDDGSFAVAILFWVVLAVLGLGHFAPHSHWDGIVLFAGLALILLRSVLRFADSKR